MQNIHVLVVDDHDIVRRGITDILSSRHDVSHCTEVSTGTEALEVLAKAGETLGFEREDLSFLNLPAIKASGFSRAPYDLARLWEMAIKGNRKSHEDNSKLVLPPIIMSDTDIMVISSMQSRPNFITGKSVSAQVVTPHEKSQRSIRGKIVLLPKADPGYDWIFTQNIKGLITKYGGVASHMSIRCAEFNIPAAIGCGDRLYDSIEAWGKVTLDCALKKITPMDMVRSR